MEKILRKQKRLQVLRKKLNKLARLEKIQEKQSKKAKETFWKFIHWSLATLVLMAVVFGYGTFFPNPVSISKIQHTQHHDYINKLDSKLDKITIQNRKNLEESLLIENDKITPIVAIAMIIKKFTLSISFHHFDINLTI